MWPSDPSIGTIVLLLEMIFYIPKVMTKSLASIIVFLQLYTTTIFIYIYYSQRNIIYTFVLFLSLSLSISIFFVNKIPYLNNCSNTRLYFLYVSRWRLYLISKNIDTFLETTKNNLPKDVTVTKSQPRENKIDFPNQNRFLLCK